MLEIVDSNPNEPFRVIIYGTEGIGKSTFGAKSVRPIFISPEAGVSRLRDRDNKPVKLFKGMSSWDQMIEAINYVLERDHDFKTLVIDSADWVEGLAHKKIVGSSGKTIITVDGGYGSGYRKSQNMHQELISLLEKIRLGRNMDIIVTAHYMVKEVKDPAMLEDYDAYNIKVHDFVSAVWREWIDCLFFARFRTYLKTDEETKARALTDGSRVVYTRETPAYKAKNRYGMPPELEFTEQFYDQFIEYVKAGVVVETKEDLYKEILELISHVPSPDTQKVILETLESQQHDTESLKAIRSRLYEITGKGA